MWFYRESFRLFSILFFMLLRDKYVESLRAKYVSSIEIDKAETITQNLPKIIIIVMKNEGTNNGGLLDLLNQREYNIKSIKDLEIPNVLREEYENACVKVAIRKCYKAMKGVKNKLCKSSFRCKSDFKDDFILESKKKCIIEFDYSKLISENIQPLKFRGAAEFVDITRQRYIEMCIPYMARRLKLQDEEKNNINTFIPHIFRKSDTKSERECQEISRNKCIFACEAVRKSLCSVHECGRRKRKYFKKACKEVCKREYRIQTDSSESDYDDK